MIRNVIEQWKGFTALKWTAALGTALCLGSPTYATFPGRNGLIAFAADVGAGYQIYTVRANGRDLRQITHLNGNAVFPDWSPDGRRIVFEHDTPDVCAAVAFMNPDGSDLVELPPGPNVCEGDPSFTPDGARVVFGRYDGNTNDEAIWSMNLDGSDRRRTDQDGPDPNVSPDGKTLSFVGLNGLDFGQALFTVGMSGGNLFQLTPFTFDVAVKQDWAPDGQHLAFTDNADFPHAGDSANILTIRPDGSHLLRLTHYQGGDVNAFVGSYSPNGRWIVFRLEDHGSFGLFRMHPDGSHIQPILDLSSFKPRFIDWGSRPSGGADADDEE